MLYAKHFDLADADSDFFVGGATGDLQYDNLVGSTPKNTPDGLAHQLSFVASGSIASAEFEVTGVDADGNTITETVTGVTTSPVETTKYYKTVTTITSDDDISTETLDVGFVDEAVSPTIRLNWRRANADAHVFWDESGTLEADVQLTVADPGTFAEQELVPWTLAIVSGLDDVLDNEYHTIPAGVVAARLRFNSYSNGAEARLYISQSEV